MHVAKYLIINFVTQGKQITTLMFAVKNGYFDIIKMFLLNKADLFIKDSVSEKVSLSLSLSLNVLERPYRYCPPLFGDETSSMIM